MKLSLYTFIKDALFFDYHAVDMLKHHVPLADEIVVCEGHSSDGTYDAIRDIDPKIRIYRQQLDTSNPNSWLRTAKDHARRRCTGDWCVLLDCDEFIPEWDFDRLRCFLETANASIVAAKYRHFYGNYKVYYDHPNRLIPPRIKSIIHRNRPDVEIIGDGSDVIIRGSAERANDDEVRFEVHHFGEVRKASRLRHKWRIQGNRDIRNRWDWMPSFLFDLFPHQWHDPDVLPHLHVYEGPHVKAVRDNPSEFVRDRFSLYETLRARAAASAL